MKKKIIAAFLTTAMTIGSLSGVTVFAADAGTDEKVEMADASDVDGTTITFWHSMGGVNGEAIDTLVKKFNDENEYGITVDAQYQGEYDDSLESLLQSPTYLLFEDFQGVPLAVEGNDPPAAVRALPAMGDVLGGPGEEVPLMAVSPARHSAGCVETGPVMLEETLVAHGFPVMLEQPAPNAESSEMTLLQFYSSTTMS